MSAKDITLEELGYRDISTPNTSFITISKEVR